jgi:hypothetical protein
VLLGELQAIGYQMAVVVDEYRRHGRYRHPRISKSLKSGEVVPTSTGTSSGVLPLLDWLTFLVGCARTNKVGGAGDVAVIPDEVILPKPLAWRLHGRA